MFVAGICFGRGGNVFQGLWAFKALILIKDLSKMGALRQFSIHGNSQAQTFQSTYGNSALSVFPCLSGLLPG
jgi:hypothetical protein